MPCLGVWLLAPPTCTVLSGDFITLFPMLPRISSPPLRPHRKNVCVKQAYRRNHECSCVLLFKILLLEYQFFPEMFKQVRESVMITKIRLYTEHETFFCVGPAEGVGGEGELIHGTLWYMCTFCNNVTLSP